MAQQVIIVTSNDYSKLRLIHERTRRGNKCALCPSTVALEFAHTKPTGINGRGRGRNRRINDIVKHPDSYLLLCHHCHIAYDATRSQSNGK